MRKTAHVPNPKGQSVQLCAAEPLGAQASKAKYGSVDDDPASKRKGCEL